MNCITPKIYLQIEMGLEAKKDALSLIKSIKNKDADKRAND
jgi:hypothetical protein